MKVVEIVPRVSDIPYGYKGNKRVRDTTEKFSLDEINKAIKTAEYQSVSPDTNISVVVSKSELEYIDAYAKQQNISVPIAVQWFWNQGFRLMVGIHRARKVTQAGLGEV
jgi:hypothetical protein